MGLIFAIVMLLAALPQASPPAAQAAPTPPPQTAAAPCAVSDVPMCGLAKENAVPIGGGAMYVAAREQRDLNALRGPEGQTPKYRRLGSTSKSPTDMTILDHHEAI